MGHRGLRIDRSKDGSVDIGLELATSANEIRNLFAEYASAIRWSNMQPTTVPPHLSSVTCYQALYGIVTIIKKLKKFSYLYASR